MTIIPPAIRALSPDILERKGSPNTASVPAEVRMLLNVGLIESVNLSEWLVVDQLLLAETAFSEFGWQSLLPQIATSFITLKSPTTPQRIQAIGIVLAEHHAGRRTLNKAIQNLQRHRSDLVRSWGCAMIGHHSSLSLLEKTEKLRMFADDSNMSVRELAWMALRNDLARQLNEGLALLQPWVSDESARIRRFASEATRPCGVWCRHIQALKDCPQLGLPLLEQLRSDDSKYVRDSVANWLNDASKSQPEWVRDTCQRWLTESPTGETAQIVRRATRTLRKRGDVLEM